MTIETLLPIAIKASLMLMVLSFGLKASPADATYLFRNPAQLVRAILSMDVVVPLIAIGLATGFNLEPPVKIALVTLALAPLPPVFFKKPIKAGGTMSYTIGLFVTATLVAVVFIPLALELIEHGTSIPLAMPMSAIWTLVFSSLLLPLVVGIVINRFAPAFAQAAAGPTGMTGMILLVVAVIPILVQVWPAMMSLVGNGVLLAMVIFAVLALASGHLLGGPNSYERPVLALASAARHPGIAIAIAHTNFPDQKLAPAAVLLYLIVSGVVTTGYLKWVERRRARPAVVVHAGAG